jgi:hypothetical protein
MSAWTKFATQFFHNKQKQNAGYKFSQALKEASKVYKQTKGGSSKNCRGGDSVPGTVPGTVPVLEEVEDIKKKIYSFNDDATDFVVTANGVMNLEQLHDIIQQSTIDITLLNAMKKKFNELDEFKKLTETEQEDMKFVLNDEVIANTPVTDTDTDTSTGMGGGKKSKRKSKKAGKKSQKKSKKSKKAGSKKSKK